MKQKILLALMEQIQNEIGVLEAASESAAEAATHEESRAEDQHDTRSVEASYLAAGTAKRIEDLHTLIRTLQGFAPKDFSPDEAIDVGALVELTSGTAGSGVGNSGQLYFLCPTAGGYKLEVEGKTVHIITVQSKVGEELLDKCAGDEVEVTTNMKRTYDVKSVR